MRHYASTERRPCVTICLHLRDLELYNYVDQNQIHVCIIYKELIRYKCIRNKLLRSKMDPYC